MTTAEEVNLTVEKLLSTNLCVPKKKLLNCSEASVYKFVKLKKLQRLSRIFSQQAGSIELLYLSAHANPPSTTLTSAKFSCPIEEEYICKTNSRSNFHYCPFLNRPTSILGSLSLQCLVPTLASDRRRMNKQNKFQI